MIMRDRGLHRPLQLFRRSTVVWLLCVSLLSVATMGTASAGEPGDAALYVPDFTLPTHTGGKVKLSKALEKGPVILDFWATWCVPCRKAMPIYAELAEQYADQGLQFLPVSLDTKKAQKKIQPLFEKQGWKFPSLLDPKQKVASKLRIMSLPTMFLVDQHRRVVKIHVGFRPGMRSALDQEIQQLLGIENNESGR